VAVLNTLTLLVALIVSTVVHEAAHALVGRALGFGVMSVSLGRGRAVWARKVGATQIVLQVVPFTGATRVVAASTRWLRLRLMLLYAAGPASNLLLLAACIPLLSERDTLDALVVRPAPVLALALANGMLALFNLIPHPPRVRRGVRSLGSDGWNVLAAPFRREASLVPLVIAHAVWESSRLIASGGKLSEASALVEQALKRDPASPIARIAHADLLVAMGRWPEAVVWLRSLLTDAAVRTKAPDAVPLLANNLAWAAFMQDDPSLLEEAEVRSKEALAAAPDLPSAHGTRGAVLLAQGALDEAEERLAFAFARNGPHNGALNACCLAMLHARRGQRTAAETWLETARSLSPKCALLARAEAALGEAA
jgi:Flp pilus assembly protein TadD